MTDSPLKFLLRSSLPADMEPVKTLRGHTSAVTSVCVSPLGEEIYTGSVDSTIRCWKMPDLAGDIYGPYDPKLQLHTFVGHTDIVWDVATHSSRPILASSSSDGTVKIWSTGGGGGYGLKSTLRRAISDKSVDNREEEVRRRRLCPTSICWLPQDLSKLAVSYGNGETCVYDVETEKCVFVFAYSGLGNPKKGGDNVDAFLNHTTA